MSIKKESIYNRRRTENKVALFAKITYISSDELPYFTELNERIAKKLNEYFMSLESYETMLVQDGILLLSPCVTYLDDDIISAKYDLTLSSSGIILSHSRFCINVCEKFGLLLSRRFFTHLPPFFDRDFYITADVNGMSLVPIDRMLECGIPCKKTAEIDLLCNGDPIRTRFKVPHGVDAESVSRTKSKAERDRTRPA